MDTIRGFCWHTWLKVLVCPLGTNRDVTVFSCYFALHNDFGSVYRNVHTKGVTLILRCIKIRVRSDAPLSVSHKSWICGIPQSIFIFASLHLFVYCVCEYFALFSDTYASCVEATCACDLISLSHDVHLKVSKTSFKFLEIVHLFRKRYTFSTIVCV